MKLKSDFVSRKLKAKDVERLEKRLGVKFPPYEALTVSVGYAHISINSGSWCFMFPFDLISDKERRKPLEVLCNEEGHLGICVNWPNLQHEVYNP